MHLWQILARARHLYPAAPAVVDGGQVFSWEEIGAGTDRLGAWLRARSVAPGDRVAALLPNSRVFLEAYFAAAGVGAILVPLNTRLHPEELAFILRDSGSLVLLADPLHAALTAEVMAYPTPVTHVLSAAEPFPLPTPWRVAAYPEGAAVGFTPEPTPPDAVAHLYYTSGTTGSPKGVMLTHRNVVANVKAVLARVTPTEEDVFLSFLPLSHTFERTVGYYLAVMAGVKVAFARSVQQLSEDLQIIHPTLLISVPRIYERVYGAVRAKLAEGSPLKRKLFELTVETGWARFLYQQGRGKWQASFLLWPLLQKLVAQKVLDRLGGRLRIALSGGAALSPEISRIFIGLGLPVVQGYGLTETSPVISGNHPENNFPDSVGQPIRDVQVRLGERHELLVKGPNVMLGYWNNPEATRAIIDADGWLNTGDVVRISETGHIYITGRTKEIIVMSNGEKIPPNDMELAILHDPLFGQVMVFGEAHPYLVVLAVLNHEVWRSFAKELGVRADMPEALTDSRVEGEVLKRIALKLHGFPGYAHVRRVLLLQEPWTMENNLLTPTLKLKRDKVAQRFATQIEALYQRH